MSKCSPVEPVAKVVVLGCKEVAVPQPVAHPGVEVDPEQHLQCMNVLRVLQQDLLIDGGTVTSFRPWKVYSLMAAMKMEQ